MAILISYDSLGIISGLGTAGKILLILIPNVGFYSFSFDSLYSHGMLYNLERHVIFLCLMVDTTMDLLL